MTAGEMTAALAQWKDQVESRGKGWPTDGELAELLVTGAGLENARLKAELQKLFDANAPPLLKLMSADWIDRVKLIFERR